MLSLLRVVHAIRPARGAGYPVVQPQLAVFAQLTGGRGVGSVRVELRHADSDAVIHRTRSAEAGFDANDPLAVRGVRIRILNLTFPVAGLYWVQLWYDGEVLAQAPVLLRAEHPSST
jgi:hypothetical protein